MSRSVLKNILSKSVMGIFNMLVPLLVIPYVYRVLNPQTVGYVEYGATLYSYFGLLGVLGIYNYGLREVSRVRDDLGKVQELYKNLFVTGLLSNLFFFVVYIAFTYFFIHDPVLREIMFVNSLALLAQIFSIEWMNEAYEEYTFIAVKTVIVRTCNVVLIFLLVKNAGDYLAYVYIITLYWFVCYGISFFYIQKHVRLSIKGLFQGLHLRRYIVPLLLILVLNNTAILYTVADRTMLGYYCGEEEVAYYSIGQKMIEIMNYLLLAAVFVMVPRLSNYLGQDKMQYERSLQRVMRATLMIVCPIAIGLCMLSEEAVLVLAGEQYIDAVPSLRIFAIRAIGIALTTILYNQVIFLFRKEKLLVVFNLLCGGVNVALNFVFLDYFSPAVAIFTTLFAEILFQAICFIYIKKKLHVVTGFFDRRNLKYIGTSLLFIPVILLCRLWIENWMVLAAVAVLLCVLLYLSVMAWAKDEFYVELRQKLVHR